MADVFTQQHTHTHTHNTTQHTTHHTTPLSHSPQKVAKLQEEIDAALERANVAERNLKEQEVLNIKMEAELRAKDGHIAELERELSREQGKRKEAEENLSKLHKELEALTL